MSITLPKIFLDSSDPEETKKARSLIGFVDGQTTNPTLVSKNPTIQQLLQSGKKLSEQDVYDCYKDIIVELDHILAGPISVEVFATWDTTPEAMLAHAEKMTTWGKNIYIKFPTIPSGVQAAQTFVKQGGNVNMTLVFDQMQAGAAYIATLESKHHAFVSPFIGRWDDRGMNGLDLVQNIIKMYRRYDKKRNAKKSHIDVLAASIRNLNHFYSCIFMGADIMTVPLSLLTEWIEDGQWMPDERFRPDTTGLKALVYEDLPYRPDLAAYDIQKIDGTLLADGLAKFVSDWEKLITVK